MLRTESWMKVNRILKGLVGCEAEFVSAQEISEVDWSAHEILATREKNADQPGYLIGESGSSIGFPLFADGDFTGLAVIRGCNGRVPDELQKLADLLISVMQRSLAIEQIDETGIFDASLGDGMDDESNVVQLHSTRYNEVREMLDSVHEQNTPVAGPFLIENADATEIHRAAVENHEASDRWAMLPLEGLAAEVLENRTELKSLGGASIFVADLAKLSPARQALLRDYLAIQPGADMPRIIAGCTDRSRVLPQLLKCFERSQNIDQLSKMIPFHIQYLDQDHPTVH